MHRGSPTEDWSYFSLIVLVFHLSLRSAHESLALPLVRVFPEGATVPLIADTCNDPAARARCDACWATAAAARVDIRRRLKGDQLNRS